MDSSHTGGAILSSGDAEGTKEAAAAEDTETKHVSNPRRDLEDAAEKTNTDQSRATPATSHTGGDAENKPKLEVEASGAAAAHDTVQGREIQQTEKVESDQQKERAKGPQPEKKTDQSPETPATSHTGGDAENKPKLEVEASGAGAAHDTAPGAIHSSEDAKETEKEAAAEDTEAKHDSDAAGEQVEKKTDQSLKTPVTPHMGGDVRDNPELKTENSGAAAAAHDTGQVRETQQTEKEEGDQQEEGAKPPRGKTTDHSPATPATPHIQERESPQTEKEEGVQQEERGKKEEGAQPPQQEKKTEHSPASPTSHLPGGVIGLGVIVAVLAVVAMLCLPRPMVEPERPNLDRVEVFREEMARVEESFRSQRTELWRRSRIHLQRHLKSAKHSEPVSLILVGGRKAERTLECLARALAGAFSKANNGSVLQLDGASMASMDHDQVKLDLDNKLRKAFEGDQPAAVIHRLEELPPSSTLIFYRYCDHENAAYKDPLLAFTVLLPRDEVGPEFTISQVEEMAHSHIHQKFLTSDQPDTFDRMDVDKLSGLWSRISHLILPVSVEEHMEKGGCDRN